MSSEYFGLVMDPFQSGPDTRFLYMDPARRNVFAQLLSSVYEGRGLVLLSGARGLGKSTLIRHLAEQLSALDSVLVLYPGGVLNCRPGMSFADVLAACRGRFDRRQPSAGDEERLMATLERAAGRGQVVVLMLDDADALDDATHTRLRHLSEPDEEDRRLMSVILVGSQRLERRLEHLSDGDGFVELTINLPPLRDRDVDRLVRHRLTVAGHGDGDLFSPVALAEIARRCRGNPTRINALCEAAMALAEREAKSTVSRDLVERAASAIEDLDDDDDVHSDGRREPPASFAGERGERGERAVASPGWNGAPEPHANEAARRIDDVAEAIRAADRRSLGGSDPHIKYGLGASHGPIGLDEPEHAPERGHEHGHGHAPIVDDGYAARPRGPAVDEPRFVDEHRFYAGARPSETYPPRRRRGWLATTALVALVLLLVGAGGLYASRTGLLDLGDLAQRAEVLASKAARLVSATLKPDPSAEEGVAGVGRGSVGADRAELTPPAGVTEDPRSSDLKFDRFGSSSGVPASRPESRPDSEPESRPGNGAAPVESYQFAPPPPQAPWRGDAGGASQAAPPLPQASASDQGAPQASIEDVPSPAGSGNASGQSGDGNLLDPSAAAILSRRGPPEATKPTPPAREQPASAEATTAPGAPAAPPAPPSAPVANVAPQAPPSAPAAMATPPAAEPAPPAAPRGGRAETRQAQAEPLLARGDEYLVTADLDMARTFYQMAYERGSAEAAVRMGWTFDPQYFQRAGLRGEASPREAILWYQEALRRGSGQASQRLSALATWLQSAAASGDLEAQRILKLWQG